MNDDPTLDDIRSHIAGCLAEDVQWCGDDGDEGLRIIFRKPEAAMLPQAARRTLDAVAVGTWQDCGYLRVILDAETE